MDQGPTDEHGIRLENTVFTGIVEELGVVSKITNNGMTVKASRFLSDVKLGDSIAVNGTCLTAVSYTNSEY